MKYFNVEIPLHAFIKSFIMHKQIGLNVVKCIFAISLIINLTMSIFLDIFLEVSNFSYGLFHLLFNKTYEFKLSDNEI